MFLSFLDGWDITNFALTRKFESIFFVSSFWMSQKKMKTPTVGSTHSHKDHENDIDEVDLQVH